MKIFSKEITFETVLKVFDAYEIKYELAEENRANCFSFDNVSELLEANRKSICFYENEKYLKDFQQSKAGLILITGSSCITESSYFLKVSKPYLAFMTLVSWWLQEDITNSKREISNRASIHKTAKIGANVQIDDFVVIEEDVIIGDNTCISVGSVIMKKTKIGKNCKIFPNVVVYENCIIGDNVIIHSSSVIGADGFGFLEINGSHVKIPQVGNVVIENDVEIGANTCIDRATIGTTLVKTNTKIDNLVQIGHNCTVEESSILCSQVGLAGNTFIGRKVYLAGQVGVAGHLKIEDNTMVGAQSGVASSLKSGKYFGSPAIPSYEQMRIIASLKKLPELIKNKHPKNMG